MSRVLSYSVTVCSHLNLDLQYGSIYLDKRNISKNILYSTGSQANPCRHNLTSRPTSARKTLAVVYIGDLVSSVAHVDKLSEE